MTNFIVTLILIDTILLIAIVWHMHKRKYGHWFKVIAGTSITLTAFINTLIVLNSYNP